MVDDLSAVIVREGGRSSNPGVGSYRIVIVYWMPAFAGMTVRC
jgi:hypothetical protein